MRKSRFTEAQIIGMIKEKEAEMPTGEGGGEACDEVGFVDEATFVIGIQPIYITCKEGTCGTRCGACGAGGALQFGGDTAEACVGQRMTQTAFALIADNNMTVKQS